MAPTKAFILAAGFGTRMRPLTETTPKPLLEIGGRSLLQHNLDHLEKAGVTDVIINTHYLAQKFEPHLKDRSTPNIHLAYESEILDRAGGIKKAIDFFEGQPFYVLNGDGFWIDGPRQTGLEQLAGAWDPEKMDIVLCLTPVEKMNITEGVGDYDLQPDGRLHRRKDQGGGYMFHSLRLNHPRIFEPIPEGPYDYLDLMDAAEEAGRLYGVVHDGEWHHISTPEDLEAVRTVYEDE